MKHSGTRRLFRLGLISVVSAAVIWAAISLCQMREPAYGKHLLSEWLDAYDTNLRFADEVPTRSGFTDEQIDEALNDIGENAFPQLLRWLQARDSPLKLKINSLLGGQPWIRFRFEAAIARQCLAETGFIYYGPSAKAARPTLIQMTLSKDPNERDLGYEGFFFTRPEAHDFLPVAYRALEEPDPDTRAMAAQWTVERFPEEAEGLGLRSRFPQFYSLPDEQALE